MDQDQHRRNLIGYFLVSLGALFYCYEFFIRISPSVMKPELMDAFHINATMFGTLSAFYFYSYTPMQLVVGVLVDRFPPRLVLSVAVAACALGSYFFGQAETMVPAAAGRLLQGFGSAFAFVGTLKLAATWLPREKFAFFSGMSSSLGFLGAAFGEIALSQFVETSGWRVTQMLFAGCGVVLFLLFIISLRKTGAQTSGRATMGSLNECLSEFKVVLGRPRVWMAGAISYLMFLPTSVFAALWGVPYMEKFHGYTASQAATAVSMIFMGWALGCPLTGWLSDYFRNRVWLVRIGSLIACVFISVFLYVDNLSYILLCLTGLAFGASSSVQALTFVMAGDLVPRRAVGTAVAFVNMLAMLGGLIFQRGIGQLLDWGWDGKTLHGIRVYSIQDYENAMLIMPACLILSTVIALFMKDTPHPGDRQETLLAETEIGEGN